MTKSEWECPICKRVFNDRRPNRDYYSVYVPYDFTWDVIEHLAMHLNQLVGK